MSKCADCVVHRGRFVNLREDGTCPTCGAKYIPRQEHTETSLVSMPRPKKLRRPRGKW